MFEGRATCFVAGDTVWYPLNFAFMYLSFRMKADLPNFYETIDNTFVHQNLLVDIVVGAPT